jgi:hypothetical protein
MTLIKTPANLPDFIIKHSFIEERKFCFYPAPYTNINA